jgi:hypothetical protein
MTGATGAGTATGAVAQKASLAEFTPAAALSSSASYLQKMGATFTAASPIADEVPAVQPLMQSAGLSSSSSSSGSKGSKGSKGVTFSAAAALSRDTSTDWSSLKASTSGSTSTSGAADAVKGKDFQQTADVMTSTATATSSSGNKALPYRPETEAVSETITAHPRPEDTPTPLNGMTKDGLPIADASGVRGSARGFWDMAPAAAPHSSPIAQPPNIRETTNAPQAAPVTPARPTLAPNDRTTKPAEVVITTKPVEQPEPAVEPVEPVEVVEVATRVVPVKPVTPAPATTTTVTTTDAAATVPVVSSAPVSVPVPADVTVSTPEELIASSPDIQGALDKALAEALANLKGAATSTTAAVSSKASASSSSGSKSSSSKSKSSSDSGSSSSSSSSKKTTKGTEKTTLKSSNKDRR